MPRKRPQEIPPHTYSVFVDTREAAGTILSERVYFGNSEYTARMKLAGAIMDNPHAWRVDVRRDLRLLVRVTIERPGSSLP